MQIRKYKIRLSILIVAVFFIISSGNKICFGKVEGFCENNVERKKILIDPGHGGVDGGAISKSGAIEKDINLKISLKLREKLQNLGFEVVMTREEDKALDQGNLAIKTKKGRDLNARCKIKEECNCDLFVSIHLNAFPQTQYYGAQVWHSKSEESRKIAQIIQQNFKADIDETNNRIPKVAKGEYKILRCDNIPSLIIECGFLSNAVEEEKLKQDEYQGKIANSIAKSIKEYYGTN